MKHYADTRIILEQTRIRHERVLPPRVFGEVMVREGHDIQSQDIVVKGVIPQDFRIIDVAGQMGLNRDDPEQLKKFITLEPDNLVDYNEPLAEAKRRRDRRLIPRAPAAGVVKLIDQGRVILQINPEPIEIRARVPGRIMEIIPYRGAEIETTGSLIQCAWGNGSFTFSHFEFEPEGGLKSLEISQDDLLAKSVNRVYILERSIGLFDLSLIVKLKLAGLVAPSMSYNLREAAMAFKVPIILTEGFGNLTPTPRILRILRHLGNRAAAFDARTPHRWSGERPEIIIPSLAGGQMFVEPKINAPLAKGMTVRLQRAPFAGQVGTIAVVPETIEPTESGLRVPTIKVKLPTRDDLIIVPVANVQLVGEG